MATTDLGQSYVEINGAQKNVVFDFGAFVGDLSVEEDASSDDISLDGLEQELEECKNDDVVANILSEGTKLREYTKGVENNVRKVELDSIQDYIKESDNLVSLHDQIRECDRILSQMETLLSGFQVEIGSISSDIKVLQEKSMDMGLKLKNRKSAESKLAKFVEDIIVPPRMVDIVVDGEVNDEYMRTLEILSKKLKFVEVDPMVKASKALKDIQPELEKVRQKAVSKVFDFIVQKLYALRKPKTNIQILQQSVLLKYKYVISFLKEHGNEVYIEVRAAYIDTMNKVLSAHFRAYILALEKLQLDIATSSDLIGVETRSTGLFLRGREPLKNRSAVFALGDRIKILKEIDEPALIPHIAEASSSKYPYEVLFRSLHKLLMDTATSEYHFCDDFFGEESIFYEIFAGPFAVIDEHFNSILPNCYDAIGLMLMIRIIHQHQLIMSRRRIPCLDSFLDKINISLWPRFKMVFDMHLNSLRSANVRTLWEDDVHPHYVMRRYAEFTASLIRLNVEYGDGQLDLNLERLRMAVDDLLIKLAKMFPKTKLQIVFLINNYDMTISILKEAAPEGKIQVHFEELLKSNTALFVEELLLVHFSDLIKFVKTRASEDPGSSSEKPITVAEVDPLVKDFASRWKAAIELMHKDVITSFSSLLCGMEILRAALTQLLLYYTRLSDCIKRIVGGSEKERSLFLSLNSVIRSLFFPSRLSLSLSLSVPQTMAERGSYGLPPRLDIKRILTEAQNRWLRPAEICEILRNYQKFQIASEPPIRPISGSLFLFDRKVLRYFRKDGHNWRKKKDGKTVKEAHEKLKVGSVDVLHCYYAHGEENENFQRRSYWMLEQDLMHIVFVHYLEVKGSRTNIGGIKESDEVTSTFQKDSPTSSSFSPNHNRVPCGSTDSPSPASSLTSLYEDVDSEDVVQASSTSHSFLESQPMENGPLRDRMDAGVLNSYFPHPSADDHGLSSIPGANYISHVWTDRSRESDDITSKTIDLASWEEVLEHSTRGFHSTVPSNVSSSSSQPASIGVVLEEENMTLGGLLASGSVVKEEFQNFVPIQSNWQIPLGDNSVNLPIWPTDQSSHLELTYDLGTTLVDPKAHDTIMRNGTEPLSTQPVQQNEQPVRNKHQIELTNTESQSSIKSISKMDMPTEGNINYALTLKKHLIDGEQGLKKVDSFSRWASKELGDVDDFNMQTSSGISWSTVECGNVVDDSSLSPSISQDQFFSIIDFSPKWAYTDSENEVLIIGKFLKSLPEVTKCNWSCMFGEVEVPAEVLAIGVLCCRAPPHSVGRVPFYVTCSNRLACSEVREFDYRVGSIKDIDVAIIYGGATTEMLLHMRLERLLSLISVSPPSHFVEGVPEKQDLISKVISLKEEEEYYQMAEPISQNDPSQYEVKEHLLKVLMKEKLYSWLLHKVSEDGKGPSVLDDEGQGVLHLAAALGYDWAIKPIVTSGVSINFRDINGWTALHWAACCGREQTVGFLVSLGASPGALTDPSPEFPLGRTPADLAGVNGHKGISGFLAEHLLTSYLKSLEMNDPNEVRTEVSGQKVSEQIVTPANYGDIPEALSLRDSLTAVSNATLAADRIHLMFRMHSLERRRINEYDDDIVRLSDEHALSVVAAKTRKAKQSDGVVHAAATQIQKKFRGWKKRKEFLIIRQRIVKIQAHVRGHQVRKKYRTIIWSVGILEKVILRWRRKGIGLRGFRSDVRTEDPKPQDVPSKEDDYDFLKDGRKQTEERLQKALTRVKSMVQYPEARAQYSRLRTAVEGFRETKAYNLVLNSSEEAVVADEELIDIDTLLEDVEDDSFMSMAFE